MTCRKLFAYSLLILTFPTSALASCSAAGSTVIFVNGVYTSEDRAKQEQSEFETIFKNNTGDYSVKFITGYNPSHLGGAADAVQSVFQAFNDPVSEFDLNTILMQIHSQVTTRKVLLLGHSQGSFYVNEMYKYLTDHGVPKESIAVYQIASPASFVAGGGQYVTSTNDKAMNYVRTHEIDANVGIYLNSYYTAGNTVNSAMRANITIPKEPGYDEDSWGGHHFDTYMDGAAARIVRDITAELSYLKASDTASSTEGCFTPPAADIKYKMQAAAFSALDPLGDTIKGVNTFLKITTSGILSSVADLLSPSSSTAPSNNAPQVAAAALAVPVAQEPVKVTTANAGNIPKAITINAPSKPALPAAPTEQKPVQVVPVAVQIPPPASPWSGYGGGGGGNPSAPRSDPSPQTAVTGLNVREPLNSALIATSTVTFSGTTAADAVVSISTSAGIATTTADASGNWTLLVSLNEGAQSARIQALGSGVLSEEIVLSFTVDTIAPSAPTVSIDECALSIVSGLCVLPKTTTTLTWDTSDATHYGVIRNGVLQATTTLFESAQQLADGATTTFAVVAYDAAGNAATSTAIDVVGLSRSVVINEISWAGDTDPSHQWIELKNFSSYAIDLSRFSISRSGGDPIQLSGTLQGYVAGRRENIAVVEPVAVTGTDRGGGPVLIIPFPALATSGEKLSLIWNMVPIDMTPDIGTCSGWCAGSVSAQIGSNVSGVNNAYSTLSMERADNAPAGSLAASWHSTDGYGEWLGNSAALPWGTPGTENSEGWPDSGVVCDSSGPMVPNQTLHSASGCVILMRFITGGNFGTGRYAGVFRGDVGSSTGATSFEAVRLAAGVSIDLTDAQPGEHFFFAAFENRSWASDAPLFQSYFTDGSQPAPHGNYLIVPFTYAP